MTVTFSSDRLARLAAVAAYLDRAKAVILRIAIMLSAFAAAHAQAKCASESYTISGTVLTDTNSSPISGILVAVVWNDTVSRSAVQRSTHTDVNGRYSIEVLFYPWSGNVQRTDQCLAKLTQVVVELKAQDYVEQRIVQPVTGPTTTANFSLAPTAAG